MQARIEDLVAANLQAKLDILHPDDLAQALHQFVEKEEKAALAECVSRVLQQTQVQVVSMRSVNPLAQPASGRGAGGKRLGVGRERLLALVECVRDRWKAMRGLNGALALVRFVTRMP
jgi:hypothetical protein